MTIQNKEYQNHRKTHIFFGGKDEWSTHSKPPEANRKAIVQRVISLELPAHAQSPEPAIASR